ncbi:MAG: hypothetical protein RBS80_18650 [Thermoguttaceae bacterium]|jgi:hypothetical protein|nr:hypothetical protein [Thermoguttaceae bacterium]
MNQTPDAYTVRPSGSLVEILDPDGYVVAWGVNEATSVQIVSLLNVAHVSGLLKPNHEDAD